MSCGCGGECCKQKGLGLGFLAIEPQDTGGDFWGFDDSYWQSGGGDFWGFDNPYWQGADYEYFDPLTNTWTLGIDSSSNFAQTNQGQSGFDWQSLLDWWAQLTGNLPGATSDAGSGSTPQLPGYCPGGTYHPLNDPFACVPFPPNTDATTRQRQTDAGNAANKAAQAAAARAQQQSQGCPPNTGLVKNAQGQCVCPPGYVPNAQLKKCVLVNASLAAQSNQPDWLKWLLLAGFVVLVVKR